MAAAWSESSRSFILVLGLHGAILLVQELLTMRVMGVTESFANFIIESLVGDRQSAAGSRVLARAGGGLGISAIGWYLFLSAIGVIVVHWYWRYHVPVEPRSWPNHLAGKVMPFFLLVVMFLPRVRRAFARPKPERLRVERARGASEAEPEQTPRWSIVSLIALLFSDRRCLKPGRRYRGLDRPVGRGVESNRGILTRAARLAELPPVLDRLRKHEDRSMSHVVPLVFGRGSGVGSSARRGEPGAETPASAPIHDRRMTSASAPPTS